LAAILVPSIATTPTDTSPARAHNAKHAAEHLAQRPLVPTVKLGDRRVIASQVAGHHAVGDILDTRALDRARGAVAARAGIEQQRDHLSSTGRRNAVWP
jgi:hypothetical protein